MQPKPLGVPCERSTRAKLHSTRTTLLCDFGLEQVLLSLLFHTELQEDTCNTPKFVAAIACHV